MTLDDYLMDKYCMKKCCDCSDLFQIVLHFYIQNKISIRAEIPKLDPCVAIPISGQMFLGQMLQDTCHFDSYRLFQIVLCVYIQSKISIRAETRLITMRSKPDYVEFVLL